MTELDDIIPGEAYKIIEMFGRVFQWRVVTKTFNPETNKTTMSEPVLTPVKCSPPASCIVEYVGTPGSSMIQTVGLRIITTPKHLGTIKPKVQDHRVVVGDISYLVVRVDPIYSGELIAAYKIFLIGSNAIG